MDHQPFENHIIDPTQHTLEDARAFQQHLEACPSCRKLQANWQAAEQALKRTPQLSPRPGFGNRWQASLAQRRARQQVRQIRILLLSLGLGSLASLALLLVVFFSVAKPVDLLVAGTRVITTANGWLVSFRQMAAGIFSNPLPLAAWIALGCGFCVLVTAWLFSLWRISHKGVNVQ